MTMEKLQIIIGYVLRVGVGAAFIMVVIGGGFYLVEHGNETMQFLKFSTPPHSQATLPTIFLTALNFSSTGLIQIGLLVLVILQLVRVALTAGLFFLLRERIFMGVSLFVLFVLIYSLFWSP